MGVNGIYGLSGSGLDVESLVKVGMMSKQSEYDKLYQKTVKQQWTKEALADIYSDLTTFKYTTLSGFKSQSKLNAMAATTTDSTAVTATANGAAIAMNHKVEVTSLSTNAYWMTDGTITRANTTEAGKNSIKLADNVFYSIKDNHNGTFTYKETENGDEITVNGEDTAIKFTVGDTKDPLTEEQQKKQTISYSFRELAEGKTYNDIAADVNAMGTNIKA
ncbi:MAG: flagellar hook-associated protein 2, partial [Schwartzia sp.]|nr:flagellar hook-associated protein 2 [Schwartzia sp. (in: firmicutes)]